MSYLEILEILSLLILVVTIIFTLGIIWRVEKKLDLAYKVLFLALLMLFISDFLKIFIETEKFLVLSQVSKFIFYVFLLAGIWMTRNLFRNIDGEK
jgi:hypothetical protein